MARRLTLVAASFALGVGGAACGGNSEPLGALPEERPVLGQRTDDARRSVLGFPLVATKNTTRLPGADQVSLAAAAALAVHPAQTPQTRPAAVALVEAADWASAISAAQLAGGRVGAPVLFADEGELPEATEAALKALSPRGGPSLDDAQVVRVGTAARPEGLRSTNLEGDGPPALARAIDSLYTQATGRSSDAVIVASLDAPAHAMPAAGWAAKSGDPVLWTRRGRLPTDTVAAIRAHGTPAIYLLVPPGGVTARVRSELDALGRVNQITAPEPAAASAAFAAFRDGSFGWGIDDPGHGLVFASPRRPADAAAAAPLSAAGSYGPLLVLDDGPQLPPALREYLLAIRPGHAGDPVRGVYNHGWLVGDAAAVSGGLQARIDQLLEIQPVDPTP